MQVRTRHGTGYVRAGLERLAWDTLAYVRDGPNEMHIYQLEDLDPFYTPHEIEGPIPLRVAAQLFPDDVGPPAKELARHLALAKKVSEHTQFICLPEYLAALRTEQSGERYALLWRWQPMVRIDGLEFDDFQWVRAGYGARDLHEIGVFHTKGYDARHLLAFENEEVCMPFDDAEPGEEEPDNYGWPVLTCNWYVEQRSSPNFTPEEIADLLWNFWPEMHETSHDETFDPWSYQHRLWDLLGGYTRGGTDESYPAGAAEAIVERRLERWLLKYRLS